MILEDKERFNKFIKLLPEQKVELFLIRILSSGKSVERYLAMFQEYDSWSSEILSQFSDSKINSTWKVFNESFNALRDFLLEHYKFSNQKNEELKLENRFAEFRKNEEDLRKLAEDFEVKYKELVFVAKEEMENNKNIIVREPDNKPEVILSKNSSGYNIPKVFEVSTEERGIWINGCLLSYPHSSGKNMTFFEYLYDNAGEKLELAKLPQEIKKEIKSKRVINMLNGLGFKGQILKAFFPKRSNKRDILFRREVSVEELRKNGIDIDMLIEQLVSAHKRNSPK
ncbi:MAG: hypothetical protein WCO84_02450 [bacterium]